MPDLRTENREELERYREIMAVLRKNNLGFLFVRAALVGPERAMEKAKKDLSGRSLGERLKLTCEELGPTFVKIGQILSTRTDLVPKSVARELAKLQDEVTPFSFEEAKAEIEEELQDSLHNIFPRFNEKPIAAASMAQVYDAYMNSGRHVAVKVQRPHVKKQIEIDMRILRQLAAFIDKYTRYGKLYDFSGTVEELADALTRETNFILEGENNDRLRKDMSKLHRITTPRIVWIYTTKEVLTMDFVEGIKINNVKELEKAGANPKYLAKNLMRALTQQILVNGFFHADPHPGNIMVVNKATTIEFIDLGMMGELTPRFRKQLNAFVWGLGMQNTRMVAQSIMDMDIAGANVNQYRFTKTLNQLLDRYLYQPLGSVNIAEVFDSIIRLASDYKMKVPKDLTLVGKCLGTAQGVVEILDPTLNILTVAEQTVRSLLREEIFSQDAANDIISTLLDARDAVRTLPRFLMNFFRKAEDNDFALSMKIDSLPDVMRSLERMANRVSFTIVLLAVSIVMAGIIIGLDWNSPANSSTMSTVSIFALETGLAIGVVIVVGLVFNIVWSRLKNRSK